MSSHPIPAPADPVPTPGAPPPDVLRCAYLDLQVTDLAASGAFYADVLGLVVTAEGPGWVALRTFDEFIHHNLLLREGPVAATAAFAFRVRSPEDVDRAEAFYRELDCPVERRREGFAPGVGDAVRVQDPLGFPYEFFHAVEHVERLAWAYDRHGPGALVRLDHFNQVTPDVPRAVAFMEDLGFRVTEDIQDTAGTVYAAWLRRKPTVHDTALTGGAGPALHHVAFATHEKHNILAICDRLGALRQSDRIERGPGRHGVSNAFYLYLRDPDGHRVEIYTQDYYTGDPDNPVVTWDVHDNQRRDFWGNPVVPSWYTQATPVLDLGGRPVALTQRRDDSELEVTIGADGFSYTRPDEDAPMPSWKQGEYKLGHQL
ncbi:3,4-dihydroxyphenylacetate 2,3-dioxygenase [Brevibacterium sp. 5221]|uniref:3,4-dihydroxyphenylacetate 2,3-dioxygenase n=1 Tax=Brevibacterium rongguiense TaxID=2695267 RepID=A0A6N9H5Y2_9MICO|nr:3,4-dihydroxyphenylacetate 2,3-dioxygenase [Brevibacterium rongguiense]MYM19271.1 3,4-dihydroxyphenylacetate 2,3-dioxygenase [Brevibacterium rongguiense]